MISSIISFLLIVQCSWCLPLDQFYPFGANNGDQVIDLSDSISEIPVTFSPFRFESKQVSELYVRKK